jgi:hypothetical protein
MQCSIEGLVQMMGENEQDWVADEPDAHKFFPEEMSHTHHQQVTNSTHTQGGFINLVTFPTHIHVP